MRRRAARTDRATDLPGGPALEDRVVEIIQPGIVIPRFRPELETELADLSARAKAENVGAAVLGKEEAARFDLAGDPGHGVERQPFAGREDRVRPG